MATAHNTLSARRTKKNLKVQYTAACVLSTANKYSVTSSSERQGPSKTNRKVFVLLKVRNHIASFLSVTCLLTFIENDCFFKLPYF
jgi:hypothetical protein